MSVNTRYFCRGLEFRTETSVLQYAELMAEIASREQTRSDRDVVLGHGVQLFVDDQWVHISNTPPVRPVPADEAMKDQPPACCHDCRYRQRGPAIDLQRNALRVELAAMVETIRCGWNLKAGALGGRPTDYAPCIRPV